MAFSTVVGRPGLVFFGSFNIDAYVAFYGVRVWAFRLVLGFRVQCVLDIMGCGSQGRQRHLFKGIRQGDLFRIMSGML